MKLTKDELRTLVHQHAEDLCDLCESNRVISSLYGPSPTWQNRRAMIESEIARIAELYAEISGVPQ